MTNIPGFTAEASINAAEESYRLTGEPSATNSNTARVTIASACLDICIGYCGGTYACAMGCLRLCRNIRER